MFRTLLGAMLLLMGATAAQAHGTIRIDIYEYGTYLSSPSIEVGKTRAGFGYGRIAEIELIEKTHTVVAQLGRTFGFRYRISGTPAGELTTLKIVTKFPREGILPPNGKTPVVIDDYLSPEFVGGDLFQVWTFDRLSEIVPGIWTFEIWQGDRKLGEQSFNVILPPIS